MSLTSVVGEELNSTMKDIISEHHGNNRSPRVIVIGELRGKPINMVYPISRKLINKVTAYGIE